MDLTTVLSSHATQLAVAFAGGAGLVVLVAAVFGRLKSELSLGRVEEILDVIDEHKDDILMLIGVVVILGRSVVMPHPMWIDVVESGELTWLVLAAGLGLGFGRAGKALKKKVDTSPTTASTNGSS